MKTDILIVGSGVSGLYCALKLPKDKEITIITKANITESDSYLAQGGICVMRDENDYEGFYEDTMKAGHYENTPESVDIMIKSSRDVINDLVSYGVEFEKENGEFVYTREGAHRKPRILFHEDETGKEIVRGLLSEVAQYSNIKILEKHTMVDLVVENSECRGIVVKNSVGEFNTILADYTVLATGGVGGVYENSTNFPHLTGDSLALAIRYGIELKDETYVQIHPTTLYTKKPGRRFLISESVRGEGAVLLNAKKERFVNELLPRDMVTKAIYREMEKEGSEHVWLSMEPISIAEIKSHFPNIYEHCLSEGYDVTRELIPVVPSQHYYMGGIKVDEYSKSNMERLYVVGEAACNGVHGKNRLASNSLLESLVFAKRAAFHMMDNYLATEFKMAENIDFSQYDNYEEKYRKIVLEAIGGMKNE